MNHNCINILVIALTYFLTMIVMIAVRKCAFVFMRMITLKNIISVVGTTWCSIGRWISGIIRIASIIVFCHSRLVRPSIIFKFFIKKSKCCNKNDYTDNDCSEIQIVGQLQNQISRKNRYSERNTSRLNYPQEYFLKDRRLNFYILAITNFFHKNPSYFNALLSQKTR